MSDQTTTASASVHDDWMGLVGVSLERSEPGPAIDGHDVPEVTIHTSSQAGGQKSLPEQKSPPAKATPEISWDEPAAVRWTTGGFILSETQLNATVLPASLVLTYTSTKGQTYDVGSHTLRVASTETDAYLSVPRSVTLKVETAPATITWGEPGKIIYKPGLTLGDVLPALSVDPPEAGVTHSPGSETPLTMDGVTVTATITDIAHFAAEPRSVTLKVETAPATITWGEPGTIVYKSGLTLGDVLPALSVDPPEAGVTHSPGVETPLTMDGVTVTATIADSTHYVAEPKSITLAMEPAPATITWGTPGKVAWKPGLKLRDVVPTVTVDPPEAGVICSLEADTVLNAGPTLVTASVKDTSHYTGEPVPLTITIDPAVPDVLWDPPDAQSYVDGGFVLTKTQLDAVASPGAGAPKYTPDAGEKLEPKTHKLKVVFAPGPNHASVTKEVDFEVRKQSTAITWTPPAAVDYVKGDFKLTTAQLAAVAPTGVKLVYTPAENEPLKAGTHVLKVEVKDTAQYDAYPATVKLEVRKAEPVIAWPTPAVHVLTAGKTDVALVNGTAPLNAVRTEGESTLVYSPAAGEKLTPGSIFKSNANRPKVPKSFVITAVHEESANYKYSEKTVVFTIVPHANAKDGFDGANDGSARKTSLDPKVKDAWDKDTGKLKSQAQELVSQLPNMTANEIIDHMDKLAGVGTTPGNYDTDQFDHSVNPPKQKLFYNKMWKLPNGLQVRLKPNGDPFTNPHLNNPSMASPPPTVSMFAVEVRGPTCFDYDGTGGGVDTFSDDGITTATKVTVSGNTGPWGPGQTNEGTKVGNDKQEFMDASTTATHHQCRRTKKTQKIAIAEPVSIPFGTKLKDIGARPQPGDGKITFDKPDDTVLGVGTHPVKVTAAATSGFDMATKDISVTVTKAMHTLTWAPPADVDYVAGGFALTETQLNAVLTPAVASEPAYTPLLGSKVEAGTRTLKAELVGSATRDGVSRTATLTVRKATPVITCKPDARRQEAKPAAGVALALDDILASVQPGGLTVTLDPPVGTVLPAGEHRVQARFAGTANIRAAAVEAVFTVVAAAL